MFCAQARGLIAVTWNLNCAVFLLFNFICTVFESSLPLIYYQMRLLLIVVHYHTHTHGGLKEVCIYGSVLLLYFFLLQAGSFVS